MITEQMFVKEVRKIVAENPDYIYPVPKSSSGTCSYLECNTACLFGKALSNLGITQEELTRCEGYEIARLIKDFLRDKFEVFSAEVINWANIIQRSQDKGTAWKDALKTGDEIVPKVANMYL